MRLSFQEAKFLADLFDATLRATALQKLNFPAFVQSQAHYGNDVNPDRLPEELLKQDMEGAEHDIICFRERIRQCFGL
jgi:hypothetical protein